MKNRYYKVLGLPDTASEEEVRKKYRKLVMLYHPDKNDDPGSEERFIAIKEAYEIIIGKRPIPNQPGQPSRKSRSTSTVNTIQKPTVEELRKRAAEAQERLRQQKMKEFLDNQNYFNKLTNGVSWKLMKFSAIIGLILTFTLLLDLVLPHHYDADKVTGYNLNLANGIGGSQVSLISTDKTGNYWVEGVNFSLISGNHNIWIEKSWINHNPMRILSQYKVQMNGYHINFNFFRITPLLLLLFLLPSFTLWYKRQKVSFTVLFYFSQYGVNLIMLFYLLTENRWAHILTLGFL